MGASSQPSRGAEALRYGPPWTHRPGSGLISAQHRDKVLGYYELAREEGATVVTGGGVPSLGAEWDAGSWVEPTILTGLSDEARCVREEIFGPICHVAPFDSEEEVIRRANDTDYGLCAAVWTSDLQRGHRVAAAMDCGQSAQLLVPRPHLRRRRASGIRLEGGSLRQLQRLKMSASNSNGTGQNGFEPTRRLRTTRPACR